MSSQHHSPTVDESSVKKKPEVVLSYNSTKCGVDTADQMLKYYSSRAATSRWPLNVFGNLLDIICLNAYIICKSAGIFAGGRREFLLQLAKSLCTPHVENRKRAGSTLPSHVQEKILKVAALDAEATSSTRKLCKNCKKNKTKQKCISCKELSCGTCSSIICRVCYPAATN